jgi:6-phosphogluconolactonase (cycloisomerase 2 family)
MVDFSTKVRQAAAATGVAMALAACTGGVHDSGSTGGAATAPQYTVGGTVSGLSGSGLVLASNTGETVNVSTDGTFSFKTTFPDGSPYYVLVLTQPNTPIQTCVAANGSGTIQSGNVTGITVTCKTKTTVTDTIGGVVVGLTGSGLVLQNGSDTVAVTANGSFVFPTSVPSGASYSVSVLTPPVKPYEDCAVLNGKGTTDSSDVTNIGVVCTVNSAPTHTISGTITGVTGTIVLENNGRDDLTITADGAFKFPLGIPSGSSYDVTTKSATGLLSQACTFANATGMVGDSDITNVTITCAANDGLAATVTGLVGSGLTLQNGNDSVPVTGNGTVVFPTELVAGQSYNVTIASQPTNPTQTCVVGNGAGTAPETTPVTVTCTTNTYTVTSTVSGLAGTGLTLQNTDTGETVPVSANGTVTFPTALTSGQAYNVAVTAQPATPTQTCVVSNGAGTAPEATPITVTCTTNTYTVGGTVTGFPDPQAANSTTGFVNLVLRDSVGDTVTIPPTATSPVAFTFPTPIASGATYSVAIQAQPGVDNSGGADLQTTSVCLVSGGGTGTVTNANVVNITITCVRPGGFAYVTNGTDNTISPYLIDGDTGTLLPAGSPVTTGTSPTAATVASAGSFFYVTNGGSNNVSGYGIDPNTGALTALVGSPFTIGGLSAPTSIAATQSNVDSFLYVTNPGTSGPGSISAAAVDGAGALTDVTGTPFPAGNTPSGAVFAESFSDGLEYLLEANTADNKLAAFAFTSTTPGAPTLPAFFPTIVTGNAPTSVATMSIYPVGAEASNNMAYVANSGDNTLSSYNVTNGTGDLYSVTPSIPTNETGLRAVTAAATDADCPCYVFASVQRGIAAFTADQNGILTPLTGTPFAAGAGPGPIAMLNTQFVYVVNTTDQTITGYVIQGTVPLTAVPGPAVPTGRGPTSIIVIPRPTVGFIG